MRRRRVRYNVDKTGRPFRIKTRRGAVKSSVRIEPIRGQPGLETRLTDRAGAIMATWYPACAPGSGRSLSTRFSRVRGTVGRIEPASLAGAFCRDAPRPAQRDRCRFPVSERGISDAAKGNAAAVGHRAAARRPVRRAGPSDGSDAFRAAGRPTGSPDPGRLPAACERPRMPTPRSPGETSRSRGTRPGGAGWQLSRPRHRLRSSGSSPTMRKHRAVLNNRNKPRGLCPWRIGSCRRIIPSRCHSVRWNMLIANDLGITPKTVAKKSKMSGIGVLKKSGRIALLCGDSMNRSVPAWKETGMLSTLQGRRRPRGSSKPTRRRGGRFDRGWAGPLRRGRAPRGTSTRVHGPEGAGWRGTLEESALPPGVGRPRGSHHKLERESHENGFGLARQEHAMAIGFLALLAGVSGVAMATHHGPEIDPGSMVNALLVLSGGLLIVTGRRPRK